MARKSKGVEAFSEWVEGVGGSVAAAELLPIGDSMVRHVCAGNRPLSPEVAHAVDTVSRGEFSRERLLPELFGPIKYRR